jgi:acetyltransferase-like isoleucine patch superfamily enzyme
MTSIFQKLWLDGRLYVANHIVASIPFHFVRLSFYRWVLKARIGAGSSIFMHVWFDTPGNLIIGSNTTINQKCRLDSRGGIEIGNNVSISPEVYILTAEHDIQSRTFAGITEKVSIGDYVFIGTRSTILPGVSLGKGCVVAAGAVVTKNVAPYTVVAGVPAKIVGMRSADLDYDVRYRRLYH